MERTSLARATAAVALGVAAASLCIGIIELRFHIPNSSLIYLFVVLWLAAAYGRGPAIVASVLAILADDYFFVPPLHRLWVNALPEWSALFMLLVVSVVTSHLTSLVREREAVANQQAAEAAREELVHLNEQLHEQMRVQRELARMRQQVSDREHITRAVIAAGEEERRRISRELHDVTGQNLTALLLGLQALQSARRPDGLCAGQILRLQEIAQAVQREVHDLALELRPTALDDLGLVTALETHVEHWATIAAIEVDVHCAGLVGPRLPPPIEVTLYRVIQEALTHVSKHAHARRVSLIVERRFDHVLAIIEDDGCGFDAQRVRSPAAVAATTGGLGLLSMQERVGQAGGTLTIESSPEEGTAIFVRIPLDHVPLDPAEATTRANDTEHTEYADAEETADLPRR
jgi:signal transduction histidine kinase